MKFDWSVIFLLVPSMALAKMNIHEHHTEQTYESYTLQPLVSFWSHMSNTHELSPVVS